MLRFPVASPSLLIHVRGHVQPRLRSLAVPGDPQDRKGCSEQPCVGPKPANGELLLAAQLCGAPGLLWLVGKERFL